MGVLKSFIRILPTKVRDLLISNDLLPDSFRENTPLNLPLSSPDPLILIKESEPIKEVEEAVDKRIHVLFKKSTIGKQILVHRSENSVLDHPEGLEPYEVAGRKRLATISGVNWFADSHLAAVSVYGEYLRIYKLEEYHESDEKKMRLKMIHEFTDGITFPDAVAVCQDRSLIAVTHSMTQEKGVSLHRMDKQTFEPAPAIEHLRIENTGHGVHFSPDGHYLAFTTVDGPGTVEVYDLNDSPVKRVCLLSNMHPYLRPKDVCFTADAKFIAIIYSEPLSPKFIKRKIVGRRLAIHRFDAVTGMIEEESIASLDNATSLVSCFELAAFRPDLDPEMYRLFVTNQACDKVIEIGFNPGQGSLQICGSHSADFSFPHGLDISADGKLLAVSNFGDDCIRLFELDREPKETIKDPRLHILLCGHAASPHLFGAERSLIDLAHAFFNLDYKVSCLLPHENVEYTNELSKYADAVFLFPFNWSNHPRPFDEKNVHYIEELIHRECIDIVHSNSMVVPDVLIAARRAGIRGVLHARELLSEENEIADSFGTSVEETLQALVKNADFIIANSKSTQHQFLKYRQTYRLYNAIDTNRFNLPEISATGILKVGLISNNTFKKGVQDFVELARMAQMEPLLEFYLIGPKNPDIEKIETDLRDLPDPPRLLFIDYVSDPIKAIERIDVVVNLSSIGESFGRTIAEGMAARKPVIVYDRGAMSELVKHEETGFLVQPGDIRMVLKYLLRLVHNRIHALKMGESGRQFVEKTFSVELFQKNLKDIYNQILTN